MENLEILETLNDDSKHGILGIQFILFSGLVDELGTRL